MDNLSSLKLADLKRELRARNLPITGTKQILVDRLIEAMSAEKANDESNIDDLLDEDSMLGDEESDGEAEAAVAADLTISSPTATVPPKTILSPAKAPEAVKRSASPLKTEQNGNSASQDGSPPSKKKIILNRQPVPEAAEQILAAPTAEAVKAASENKPPSTEQSGEKAVIKISEVVTAPVTDKLKLRQVKFGAAAEATPSSGAAPDVPDRLKKRAERFGVAAGTAAPATGKVPLTPEDEAKLAKRRERFGIPTDDKIEEMKQKRAARFGATASAKSNPGTGTTTTASSAEVDEKKKQRAARFAAAL